MKKIQDISVLSISLITGVATMLSVIIPHLVDQYPMYNLGIIESLVAVPSAGAIVTILLNAKIAEKIGLKKTVELGIIGAALSGIAPIVIQGIIPFFISRFLLGLGIGLFSPHAISFITLFYSGKKRATFLGLQVGITAAGNALFLLLANIVSNLDWTLVYLLYLLLIPILVLVIKYIPSPKIEQDTKQKESKQLFSKTIWFYFILCTLTFIIIYGVQLKIPTLFLELRKGNASLGGMVLSGMNLAGLLAGISFGVLMKKIGKWTLMLGYLGAGIKVFLLFFSKSVWLSLVSAILFNYVYSFTGPFIVLMLNTFASKEQVVRVNAIFTLIIIGSQFLAPIIWNFLGSFLQGPTASVLFLISSILLFIAISVAYLTKNDRITVND